MALDRHLGIEELFSRYRQATPPMELGHYQIIWLLPTGLTALEVSQVTGYTRIWINQLVKGYNSEGAQRHLACGQRIMVNRGTTGPARLGKCFGTKHQMEDCGMVVWLQIG
jgi:hypothetical protein